MQMQKQNSGSFSAGRLSWNHLVREQAYTNDCVRRRYKNNESSTNLITTRQNSQKGRVEEVRLLMDCKNEQSANFKPSIKMYYKNGKLNPPKGLNIIQTKEINKNSKVKDVYRYYENKYRPQSKYIQAPASDENTFINEQKTLLPHQRVSAPIQRIRTQISTERVFDGVRSKPDKAFDQSSLSSSRSSVNNSVMDYRFQKGNYILKRNHQQI